VKKRKPDPSMAMRVAVWGDGAVGTGLAVVLASAGHQVELVGPPGSGRGSIRAAATGFVRGSADIRHSRAGDPVEADVSLLALKAFDLAEVSVQAASSAPATVCAMNGMGLRDAWGEGWDSVERFVLTAGFQMDGEHSVVTFPGRAVAAMGGAASGLLGSTCLPLEEVDRIMPEVWAKWLVNSVINPFGALTGAANDRLYGLGLEGAMTLLFTELAAAVPGDCRERAVESASGMLTRLTSSSSNRCSMLQDLERGGRTEIDYLTGYAGREAPGSYPLARLVSDLVRARTTSA
jgi:2-dehydropantoate 2-reductase